ncbi:MAG: DUF58 domain-containing protein [Chitinophagales bacterium]|nr:DUF58 domain-containing protein [Chitinophagales bacterium]
MAAFFSQHTTRNTQLSNDEKRKKLRRIEIKTRKLTNQVFSGSYHSAFKGRGISFSEVREYQFGDDVRMIDWNVTARNNKPFIKVFEEERELTVMLLIDVSRSSFFGTQTDFKNHIIAEISAVLAFSAITNNDKVGVIFFSDVIEKFIPPKKGKSHILRIISEIYDFTPQSGKTNIVDTLRYFNNMVKKKCITFLISDFMSDAKPEELKKALTIVSGKHDLIGLHIYDEREAKMPDCGMMLVSDAETGREFWMNTSDKQVRLNYEKRFAENIKTVKNVFGKSGAQLESIKTEDNYVIGLMNMFKKREGKR